MKQRFVAPAIICLTGWAIIAPNSSAAEEKTCVIDAPRLICAASASDRKTIFEAMANPQTLKMLIEARGEQPVYGDWRNRETYRRSVEANRVAVKRYADSAWRRYRRGRMKADAYEKVRIQYSSALEAYRAGMDLYRQSTWQDPSPPRQRD